jgi:hypothetical protein
MASMASLRSMTSLRFAAAISDEHATHRVADVERHAGRAGGDERKREH